MVKHSSILRDPFLANTPLSSVFIDLCYHGTDGGGTENIVAATASEVSVIKNGGKTFSGRM